MKIKSLYILILWLTVCLTSCESLIYDNQVEFEESASAHDVYLSISKTGTSDTETINEDAIRFEDRIHDLALLVFDSSTGIKVAAYFDHGIPLSSKEKTFTVKMTTGQRDFYFIANMPMQELRAIQNKSEMITYINQFRDLDLDLYQGATADRGFPMSRIYLNQTITEGGNIYSPKPFQPTTNGASEEQIRLTRSIAKLEVIPCETVGNAGIKNIYYKNAYSQFGLMPDKYSSTVSYREGQPLKKCSSSYIFYMPEAMMMDKKPIWSSTGHKPINYFVIETLEGTLYEIPIITSDRVIPEMDYMKFATGQIANNNPDYNIYRNRHYYYQIKNLQSIEITYGIAPWTINRKTTYMGYGYNLSIGNDGLINITNTAKSCSPHSVKLKTILPFTFSDGSTEKVFENYAAGAYVQYMLNPIPKDGDGNYLELHYNDTHMKTFCK